MAREFVRKLVFQRAGVVSAMNNFLSLEISRCKWIKLQFVFDNLHKYIHVLRRNANFFWRSTTNLHANCCNAKHTYLKFLGRNGYFLALRVALQWLGSSSDKLRQKESYAHRFFASCPQKCSNTFLQITSPTKWIVLNSKFSNMPPKREHTARKKHVFTAG